MTTVISDPLRFPGDIKHRVFDITGREVEPYHLGPGIYFIELDGKMVQKVIKIR